MLSLEMINEMVQPAFALSTSSLKRVLLVNQATAMKIYFCAPFISC
jgi:hypothetical protein